jgi:hypothetical protein
MGSAAPPGQGNVAWRSAPVRSEINALDLAVETSAAHGWALYELPARQTVRTDAEAVRACAAPAARFMQRRAISYSERALAGAPVTTSRVAVGTAHRDRAHAIRALLATGRLPGITVHVKQPRRPRRERKFRTPVSRNQVRLYYDPLAMARRGRRHQLVRRRARHAPPSGSPSTLLACDWTATERGWAIWFRWFLLRNTTLQLSRTARSTCHGGSAIRSCLSFRSQLST